MDKGADLPEVGESSTGITRASITHNCVQFSDLHERILCVSEGFLWLLLCIHIVGMRTFYLHEMILCVSEGLHSVLLCIHNVGMGTFAPHGLTLCVFE